MALLNTQLTVTVTGGESNTVGLATESYPVNYTYLPTVLTNGTGANAAQKRITLNPTITTSGTTYDLTAIAGGPANANVNFAVVKTLIIENTAASATLTVGKAASSAWEAWTADANSTFQVFAGGCVTMHIPTATGGTVDASHKSFKMIASAGTIAAKIVIVGEGA